MLGFIGFIVAAVAIGAFAVTAYDAYGELDSGRRNAFSAAFYLLSMAMLVWAGVSVGNDVRVTRTLMLASDVIVAVATGYMAYILLADRWQPWFAGPFAVIGAGLIALRAYVYVPQAFVSDGLLYFNLAPGPQAVIVGLFALVWLPAEVVVARRALSPQRLPGLQHGVVAVFLSLVITLAFLLSTQRASGITSSFVAIIVLFLAAVAMNVFIACVGNNTKRSAPHAVKSVRGK